MKLEEAAKRLNTCTSEHYSKDLFTQKYFYDNYFFSSVFAFYALLNKYVRRGCKIVNVRLTLTELKNEVIQYVCWYW